MASHSLLGEYILSCDGDIPWLFTENETNHELLFPGQKNESPHVKDGINDCVVQGKQEAVNPAQKGTKAAAHFQLNIGAGESAEIRLRLSKKKSESQNPVFGEAFEKISPQDRGD